MDVALGRLLAAKAWRTASWTAQKKRWIWPWGRCCLRWKWRTALGTALKKRWIGPWGRFCLRWTPIRSHRWFEGFEGCGGFGRVERLDGFKGLGAGKRQAWTPIRWF